MLVVRPAPEYLVFNKQKETFYFQQIYVKIVFKGINLHIILQNENIHTIIIE